MGRNQMTFQKRQRELERQRRRDAKAAKRRQRAGEQDDDRNASLAAGEDPDLVGITAGPHNNPASDEELQLELDASGGVIVK